MKRHHSQPLAHHEAKPLTPAQQRLCGLGCFGFMALVFVASSFGKRKKSSRSERLELPKKPYSTKAALMAALAKPDASTVLGVVELSGIKRIFARTVPWYLSREHRERHMQIMGPTRSGKSQLLLSLCAQDMAARRSIFFMEAKGDVSDFQQFGRLARLTGRLEDLRYFNPADPESMSFNPIRPVPGQDATEVANQISRAIGREPGGGGESEFFRNVDYARIQTMTEIFMSSGLEFTLKDAFYYFQFEACRNRAYSFCKDKSLIALTKRQFEGPAGDTTALTANLRPWISGRLGQLLNSYEPQIRLEDVFSHDRLAYFAVPIGRLQVLANPLGRMVIAGLMGVAAMRQSMAKKPEPAAVILDEFPEFATPVFASLIATVGSAKLWTIFSHQDLGQLKKVQGTPPEAFFSALFSNSSGCKVFFHLPHPADAELIAKSAGTYTTTKATEAVETGLLGEMKTGGKSMREVEEFLAHPNLLRNLKPGLAVAWAHGGRASVVSTAAAHEMIEDLSPVALPHVKGVPARGLDLASALPKDIPATGDKDFMGKTAEVAQS